MVTSTCLFIFICLQFIIWKTNSYYLPSSKLLRRSMKVNLLPDASSIHHGLDFVTNLEHFQNSLMIAEEQVSRYSQVDKTGFIGFVATYVEMAIDFSRNLLQQAGIKDAYGYSIILFTVLIKVITLPLTTSQLESTTKMQKLQPLQAKIQQTYASDEQTKNQLMVELYQAAQVNPLAGCFPALVQIPIFISLYRALLNLVAENKLDEPFLWIPDLEGPVYTSPPGESLDWFKSLFSGEPKLGFEDTFAFLTLPIILFITQKISQKILQPPRDPNKILTEQEEFSQGLLNNLPFVIAFFSLNVPAGLAVYWIVNNILTTVITIVVKNQIKDEKVPREVEMIMASVAKASATKGNVDSYPKISSKSAEFLRNEEKFQSKKPSGFGNLDLVDTTIKSQNPLASENMWNKPSETTSSIEMKPVDVTNVVEEDNSNDDDDDNDDEKTTEVTTDATSRSSKQRRKQKRGGKKTSGKK